MGQTDQTTSNQFSDSFLTKTSITFVRMFGSWISAAIHTIFFISWVVFKLELDVLLVIVSLEAIYIGIFILMAENVEKNKSIKQITQKES